MTTVYIILAILVSLLAGAGLLGMGMFFWYLLKVVRSMNEAVSEFVKVIDPLIKTGTLQQLGQSSAEMVAIGRKVLNAMGAINTTVALFNQAFFRKDAVAAATQSEEAPPEGYAGKGEAFNLSYTDEAAALREKQERLRQAGYETDDSHPDAPIPAEAHGSQV